MPNKIVSQFNHPIISEDLNEKFKEILKSNTKENWVVSGPNPESIILPRRSSSGKVDISINGSSSVPARFFIGGCYFCIYDNSSIITYGISNVSNSPVSITYDHETSNIKLLIGSVSSSVKNVCRLGVITITSTTISFTPAKDLYSPGFLKQPSNTSLQGSDKKFLTYNAETGVVMYTDYSGSSFAPSTILSIDDGDSGGVNTVKRAYTANAVKARGVTESMIADDSISTIKIKDSSINWNKVDSNTKILRHGALKDIVVWVQPGDPGSSAKNGDIWIKY